MTETCENCLCLVNSCAYFARQTRKNLPGTAVLGGFQTSSQGALKSIEKVSTLVSLGVKDM